MTGAFVELHPAARPAVDRPDLPRAWLDDLHALLALDPIFGTSPARVLFVTSAANKARLSGHVCADDHDRVMDAPACALIGYDFGFAVSLLASDHGLETRSRAIRAAACSASLQGVGLTRAAEALGLRATPILHFDASALHAAFFAHAQATVVFACRLDAAPAPQRLVRAAFNPGSPT